MKMRNVNLLLLGLTLAMFGCSTSKDSSKFAKDAAQGGLAEVELGKLAVDRASDPSVKEFAQRMIDDHSSANTQLKTVASEKSMALPADLSASQRRTKDKLSGLSGADFDKAYMKDMVNDHETDVKEFQKQANEGTDPDIKAFAAKTLPTLQSHLQQAKDVAQKVGVRT
jgi:putative membrane protein